MTDQQKPQDATEILSQATPDQVRWVLARLHTKTDHEAAEEVGVHRSTVSKWDNKAELDIAVNILLREPIKAAVEILGNASAEAAQVIVDTLRVKRDNRLRLNAASDILDRVGVKGAQRHELTGAEGGPIETKDVTLSDEQRNRAISTLAIAIASAIHNDDAEGPSGLGAGE